MKQDLEGQVATRRAEDVLPGRTKMRFRKVVAGGCLGAAALMGVMGGAMAHPGNGGGGDPSGNPHFIKNATDGSISGTDLVVSFKEAGLPSGAEETVQTSANATVAYECVNSGGKHPQASNKYTSVSQVSQSGQFTADQNGNIEGSLTLGAPAADPSLTCPDDMVVTFVGVTYSNVNVTDLTSGASLDLPGSFSATNPDAPPCRNNCN